MKRFNRHGLIALIVSSLVLLAAFQFFWIQKVYDEQLLNLKKDLDHTFRSTVMGLQDSMIQCNFGDLPKPPGEVKITISSDSLNGRELARIVTHAYFNKSMADSSIKTTQVFGVTDSIRRKKGFVDTPIIGNKKNLNRDTAIFIKLNLDSLRIADISTHFELALLNQKIDLPFHIHRLHQSQLPPPPYEGITTNPMFAGVPKFNVYVAQFPTYEAFLFRKTLPQILFSLLLFGITTLAFGLVYRSLRQQERLTALKNDFISNITHELKTPIATVSVAIEALQNFNALQKPELTKEYLDISKNELSRLSMLVDKVLKLSVFEQKEPELTLEVLDIAALVAQVLDSMRLQFEKLGAKITFDTEGADNTFVKADRTHLTSVIYNLLDNALKYNGKNIRICFKTEENDLKMSIQDDGCGIAAEYQDKIFDKFFRVPTGDIHNIKGYGLGLSYVTSVMKQHSGRIEVQSTLEKGSTFSVFLPKTAPLIIS